MSSVDIVTRLRQTRANMLGTDDEQHYWDCHEAAGEIERLRTVMYRIVDEDCTVAIQGGTFYADDEPLFAITDTNEPRNGAVVGPDPDSRVWETPVHTPATQTTRGECSTPREGTFRVSQNAKATLTDAEREAIERVIPGYEMAATNEGDPELAKIAATLRGLLKRTR